MAKRKCHLSGQERKAQVFGTCMNIRTDRQARLLLSELSELRAQLLESLRTVDVALQRAQCLSSLASQLPHRHSSTEYAHPSELFRKVGRMTEHGIELFGDYPESSYYPRPVDLL